MGQPPRMMMNCLSDCGLKIKGAIPRSEIASREPSSAFIGVQEGRHYNAGVGYAEDPLVLWQCMQPFRRRCQPLIRKHFKFDSGQRIFRRRNEVKYPYGWPSARNEAVCGLCKLGGGNGSPHTAPSIEIASYRIQIGDAPSERSFHGR